VSTPSLDSFRRVVVKVGSSLLVQPGGAAVKHDWLERLADDLLALHRRGAEVLVVSSGSVALGRGVLGLPAGALPLEDSQAAAAWANRAGAHMGAGSGRSRHGRGQILVTFATPRSAAAIFTRANV